MAVQNSIYVTDGTTRTFPSTKHIATKQHVAVRGKRVFDSAWEYIEPELFNLVNNSIVFLTAPATSIYSQIEIRVADDYDELASQPNDISAVAQYLDEISVVADNIDSIIAASNGEYLTYGQPATANTGDLSVDTLTGGIYQWDGDSWNLVAQSGADISGVTPLGVNIVTGLPTVGENGEIIFNQSDGYFYGYINGVWTQMVSTPTTNDQVGIEVLADDPTTDNYEGRVIFNTTLNQLRKYTSGTWIQVVEPTTAAADVADASLTVAKFAAGIRPVEIFDTLPTTGNSIGRLVYLTTDGLVYRYTASGFTPNIPTTALTGTITETQIADDAITTPKIATGAITADTIAANAITAGKIDANAVTAGTIAAGAIGATQIAANAITSDKINAGAVTAAKIAALSIDATKIVAGSIGANQIAANSVTAGKIAAGAVSANNIAAGTITATQIATGTITAAQIASYAITASKLDVNAISGQKITITSATNSSGGSGTVGTALGLFQTSRDKVAVYGYSSASFGVGVAGEASDTGGYFSGGVKGVYGQAPSGGWGFITYQKAYAAQGFVTTSNVYSFTGSHYCISKEKYAIGDILIASDIAMLTNVSQAYPYVEQSKYAMDKRVFGVLSEHNTSIRAMMLESDDFSIEKTIGVRKIKSEYTQWLDKAEKDGYELCHTNSLGEGGINVCSEGGNIEIGDYICSSSIKGKGMKQDDDLLHNYTVAKALEAVDWSKEPSNVKMIACTYHCG